MAGSEKSSRHKMKCVCGHDEEAHGIFCWNCYFNVTLERYNWEIANHEFKLDNLSYLEAKYNESNSL